MAVAELGYKIDSSGAVVAAGDLDKMTASAIKAEAQEKKLSAATVELAKVSKTASSSYISMAASEDSAFAAAVKLQKAQDVLNKEVASGTITAGQMADKMDVLRSKYAAGITLNGKFAKAMTTSTAQTANLGAQLNDIGVMLAAGQNPLQLAVQQGTQINQVFAQMGGGMNALRGLGAGFMSMINPMSLATIGVIAGGAALVQWATAAGETVDAADELEDRYEALEMLTGALTAANDILNMSMVELTNTYGTAALRVREFALLQSELRIAELTQSLSEHSSILAEVSDKYTGASGNVTNLRTGLLAIQRDFGLSSEAAAEFRNQLTQVSTARTFEQQVAALENIDALLRANGVSAADIPPELAKALAEMIDLSNETDAARKLAGDLAGAASGIAAAIDPAIDSAAALKNELAAALSLLNAVNRQESLTYSGRGGDPRQFEEGGRLSSDVYTADMNYTDPQDIIDKFNAKAAKAASRGGSKSKGGRGAVDPYQKNLEALTKSLQTERETIDAWYVESQSLIDDRRSIELLGVEGHAEAKLRIEQEYQERLADIQGAYQGDALHRTETFMGSMAAALQGGNDKMQAAAQAFASVEALINAYRAYNQVMADPSLPWYAKIPAAAGVLAAGMKTVQSIKSLSGSGGGSATSSAPSAGSSTTTTTPQRAIIQLEGSMAQVVGPMMDTIIKTLQKDSKDGVIIEGFAY